MEHAQAEKLAFTYEESARASGLSVSMLRKLAKKGELEVIKIGRAVRVPRHALLKLCGVR